MTTVNHFEWQESLGNTRTMSKYRSEPLLVLSYWEDASEDDNITCRRVVKTSNMQVSNDSAYHTMPSH